MTFRAKMMSTLIIGFAFGAMIPLLVAAFGMIGILVFVGAVTAVVGIAFAVTCAQKDLESIISGGMVPVEIVEDVTIEAVDTSR